jgi:hypothetical protein
MLDLELFQIIIVYICFVQIIYTNLSIKCTLIEIN